VRAGRREDALRQQIRLNRKRISEPWKQERFFRLKFFNIAVYKEEGALYIAALKLRQTKETRVRLEGAYSGSGNNSGN
jgi:hypothetical protein